MQRSVYRAYTPRPAPGRLPAAILQVAAALAAGAALFLALLLALLTMIQIAYSGRIYPGVSMGGLEIAGMTRQEATQALATKLAFPQTGQLVLQDGSQVWAIRPVQLGLSLDPQANALAAYQFGRSGSLFARLADQFSAWWGGEDVPVTLLYDEKVALAYLADLAAQIDRPVKEASLSVDGLQVTTVPGQIGRRLDSAASLAAIQAQIRTLTDGVVPLVIAETRPNVLDASIQAEQARQLLSAPLTLSLPQPQAGDPGPWIIPPDQLAKWVIIERAQGTGGEEYRVGLSDQALQDYLTAVAGQVNRYPADARFIFNDETRKLEAIQPSAVGRTLNITETAQAIKQQLAAGQRSIALNVATEQPTISDTATGEQLGRAFQGQLLGRRSSVMLTAGIMTVLGVMPGFWLLNTVNAQHVGGFPGF